MPVVINVDIPQQQWLIKYAADMGVTEQEAAQIMFAEGLKHMMIYKSERTDITKAISASELKSRLHKHLEHRSNSQYEGHLFG